MNRTIIVILAMLVSLTARTQTGSVLGSGQWWRLTVSGTGMYAVTTADVPALQGASVAQIGLYGMDGTQLSTSNALTPTGDLQPIAIEVQDNNSNGLFDVGDRVVFFGEGTDVWRYSEADQRWEMQRHAYANANYYYLTTTAADPRRVTTATTPTADITLTTYTAATCHNNDLVNIYKSGQLWMGEKFTTSVNSRSVSLSLPSTASNIKLRYALASKSTATAGFTLSTNGLSRSHTIGSQQVYATTLEATNAQTQSLTFTIGYTPGEAAAEGYLDYIEMTGHIAIIYSGAQLLVRNDQHLGSGTAAFAIGGSATPRVWEVSHHNSPRAMNVSDGRWIDSTDMARTYILFSNGNLRSPAAVNTVDNQDLHGSAAASYIIVCNPLFRPQAERLASLHAILDGLSTLVVTDRQVYNEFSSGKQDPMAIRAFLRWMRDQHPEEPPRYLLLLGKGTYDNRDLLELGVPTVVTYESVHSFDDNGLSYCSDDMLGYLDAGETGTPSQSLDISIGRLPARNAAEANHLVDKIEGYMMRRDLAGDEARGDWRNYVALLADDADPSHGGDSLFAHSSEVVAGRIKTLFPEINIDRLYADSYRQQSGAIGSFYPDLNNALRQRVNYGCLLLNYIGHGSIKYIGTERYIEPSDITAYSNVDRLPLFVTSTCSYGYHDLPDDLCGAESFLHAPAGAVAVISAARPISHIERFNADIILFALDTSYTIGDALRMAKNRTTVSMCIGLLGDPALHLSRPKNRVVVTHIDGHEVAEGTSDTAKVLSQVTICGEIRNAGGQLLSDFDGTVYPIVFDRETESRTLANDNPGTEVTFHQQKNILYKGALPVSGGRFEYTFTVPRDVPYQYDYAKLSHYAVSGSEDAAGSYGSLLMGGLDEDVEICEVRPEIRLYMGDTTFRAGGITDETPTLVALLSDSVGINAFGSGLGHDITATLDGQAGSLIILNDFYQASLDDPRGGSLHYTLPSLTPGTHTLSLKAWNIWGYSNTAEITFCVHSTDSAIFSQLSAYPNPATDRATFHYETNNPAAISQAELHIYTAQGVPVATLLPTVSAGSYTLGPVHWDLGGIAPGIYLARILVTTADGETHQSTTKIVVR